MYTTWQLPDAGPDAGEEQVLGFDHGRTQRLLILPALFAEANAMRHQTFLLMQHLHAEGIDCFLPDLPGCNESLAPLSAQTLAGWRAQAAVAAKHVRATHVFGVRAGSWIAPADLHGWLLAPPRPAAVLRGLIRARIVAEKEGGNEETTEELLAQAKHSGLTLAGYDLGPDLARELAEDDFAPAERHVAIDQAQLGGQPLWLRAEAGSDPAQARILGDILAAGMADA